MRQASVEVGCGTCPSFTESPWSNLTEQDRSQLDRCKTSNKYKKGQIIFYENNKPFGVHCIRQGRLKLYRVGQDGREQIVKIAEPGDMIGFHSLLTTEDYSVTAQALEDAEICFVDRLAFFDLIDHSPSLARKLLETTCHELRTEESTICSYAQKSVRERMAETLLILKERFGVRTRDGWILDIPLKREEIAALAGTVLESAVRYLSEFKDDGMILLDGKKIVLVDLEKISHTAGI